MLASSSQKMLMLSTRGVVSFSCGGVSAAMALRLLRAPIIPTAARQAVSARAFCTPRIPDNAEVATGMERKEIDQTPDIFWSREPITGHFGTKENPAIVPSFNESRVVGLETEQGVIWFRLDKGPLHLVAGQYFKLKQLDGGEH